MRLTILGNWGAYPEANGACSGYLLNVENKNILLDCGSGVLSSLRNHIRYEDLDAVIISHYHPDHVNDIYTLHHAIQEAYIFGRIKEPLKIYGHDEHFIFSLLNYKESCKAEMINENTIIRIGEISIEFIKTNHPVTCYAMRIKGDGKTFVYTADTCFMNELAQFSKEADFLLCEASLFNSEKGLNLAHLTAGEAGIIAKEACVKELMITHFPHRRDKEQLRSEAIETFGKEVKLAIKGETIDIE